MAPDNIFNLIVEKADNGFWGRLEYLDNLILFEGDNIDSIKEYFSEYLKKNYKLNTPNFEITYDITAVFKEFSFLKISEIAKLSGINSSLLRQYVLGIKNPSKNQVKKIEIVLSEIGKKLAEIQLDT